MVQMVCGLVYEVLPTSGLESDFLFMFSSFFAL